ncbi:MAG: radical SAM protein [Anaerocolumna sp.]
MRLSNYNILVHDYPQKDYTLVYNLLSKKYICLKTELFYQYDNNKFLNKLVEEGFLVGSSEYEFSKVMNYFNKEFSGETLRLTVVLTRQCNCSCIYCYQDHLCKNSSMNQEIIDHLISFTEKYMEENKLSDLEVVFFGGEPLLKKDLITYASKKWHGKLADHYKFAIITNGTLIEKDDVIQWNKYNLNSLKITLDGIQEIHDKRRHYKSGKGSFNDIINNIKTVHKIANIVINIVLDESNFPEIYSLIDLIKELQLKLSICINLTRVHGKEITEKESGYLIDLASYIKKRNIYQYSSIGNPDGEICPYKKKHSFSIDTNLKIFMCNAFIDDHDYSIGNIDDYYTKEIIDVNEPMCLKCKYLPVCYSGCKYDNHCKKEYFKSTIPELVKIYSGLTQYDAH